MIALLIFSSRILKHVFISIILVQAPYFYKNSTSTGMRVRVSLRCPFYCCRVIMCNHFRTFHSWTHKIIVLYPDAIFQDFYLFEVCKLFVFVFIFESSCSLWFRGIAIRKIFEKTPVMGSFVVKENSVQFFCW